MTKIEYAHAVAEAMGGEVKEIKKVNDVLRTGIIVGDGNIRPTVYIDDMFDRGMSVEEAAKEIVEVVSRNPVPKLSVDDFTDYYQIKEKLRLRLYNKQTDAPISRSAEEYGFDDLIIVPYIQISDEMSTRVTQGLLDSWGVPDAIVFADAMESTEKSDDIKICTMEELLFGILPDEAFSAMPKQLVVTSRTKLNAAIGVIIKQDELKEKFPNGYYVLPSSVHECIIMPKSDGIDKTALDDMVTAVNKSEVMPDEILSWHAYEF